MTAARSYEDYDGTTTYLMPPTTPCNDAHNLTIVESIRKHAMDINALNSKLVSLTCTSLSSSYCLATGILHVFSQALALLLGYLGLFTGSFISSQAPKSCAIFCVARHGVRVMCHKLKHMNVGFGFKLASLQVYDEITTLARAERGVTGSFFWSAVGPAFLEPDSFSVRLQPIPQRQAQGLAAQISCLVEGSGAHASQVSAPQEGTLQHLCSHSNNVEAGAEYNDSAADEAILRVVVEHTSQMSSLNASWLPECPVM